MNFKVFISAILMFASGCDEKTSAPTFSDTLGNQTYTEVIQQYPSRIIEASAQKPDANGALGRNKTAYFHVRFQTGISTLAAYAVHFNNEEALNAFAACMEYSFNHQNPVGDFQIVVPAELSNLGTPTETDLASGIAFFGASLAEGLSLLTGSSWYKGLPNTHPAKARIISQTGNIIKMLAYLDTKTDALMDADEKAANRLFWNALCFYGLGKYTNDPAAIHSAEKFLETALSKQHADGYFIENGGFDTSYNTVSLKQGLTVFAILPQNPLKEKLGRALINASRWQLTKTKKSGEIDLTGNTRVYPGGEQFLGEEKGVSWKDRVLALQTLRVLSGDDAYAEQADRVESFYKE